MKINEIKEIARHNNLKTGRANKVELVRSIQQAEGNLPCFNSNSAAIPGEPNLIGQDLGFNESAHNFL